MNTESDNHLLMRWQRQRDTRAFREIANRHMAMVFATCLRVLRDVVEAEDLTQECFLHLAQSTVSRRIEVTIDVDVLDGEIGYVEVGL